MHCTIWSLLSPSPSLSMAILNSLWSKSPLPSLSMALNTPSMLLSVLPPSERLDLIALRTTCPICFVWRSATQRHRCEQPAHRETSMQAVVL